MKFEDIITLAKAGYKPGEVKELLNMCIESEQAASMEESAAPTPQDTNEEVTITEQEQKPEKKEEEIDYKKLYEESQENLKKAQKDNVRENIQKDIPNDEELLADLVRSFM